MTMDNKCWCWRKGWMIYDDWWILAYINFGFWMFISVWNPMLFFDSSQINVSLLLCFVSCNPCLPVPFREHLDLIMWWKGAILKIYYHYQYMYYQFCSNGPRLTATFTDFNSRHEMNCILNELLATASMLFVLKLDVQRGNCCHCSVFIIGIMMYRYNVVWTRPAWMEYSDKRDKAM